MIRCQISSDQIWWCLFTHGTLRFARRKRSATWAFCDEVTTQLLPATAVGSRSDLRRSRRWASSRSKRDDAESLPITASRRMGRRDGVGNDRSITIHELTIQSYFVADYDPVDHVPRFLVTNRRPGIVSEWLSANCHQHRWEEIGDF